MDAASEFLARRIERAAAGGGKQRVVRFTPVRGGYTSADRRIAHFADGSSLFVKAATGEDTAGWLRAEQRIYARLTGQPFLPKLAGWDDDNSALPLLLLEDLGRAEWPPPWSATKVDAVRAALDSVHASLPLVADLNLPSFEQERAEFCSWKRVANDPAPFLSLGLCGADWLHAALPDLLAAETKAILDGNDLAHLDVRSDNLCFRDGRAVLVDWNWAMRGNGRVDVAGWLPSLHAEGGPPPEAILPHAPELAAAFAGYWAARAGKPPPFPGARVRAVQRAQLSVALPWAARALGLPPPDALGHPAAPTPFSV
jgi:hypothetical protein